MKALKNESTIYTEQIVSAIRDCYAKSVEPSNAELLALYSSIGQCICEQGEKAFVVHLAQMLAEQLPQIKGFSPRNLRRMRDFYRTYENQPELMRKAQTLGWTQNAVILDCCETEEQRSFYIALTIEKNLSKLALMKAIESGEFESAQAEKSAADACPACCPAVDDIATNQTVDTAVAGKTACGAFVTACEPLRQGDGAPSNINRTIATEIGRIPKNRLDIYKADGGQTAHQSMSPYQAHSLLFPAQTNRGKPPNQFPPGSLPTKKKNALPHGRTHIEIKQRIPHQMPRAA